jgi:ABC-2 type transport system ATP-binding protein
MIDNVLLSVAGLRYAYGPRVAVDGISFDIRRGEIFGFLGPNGAGKTTTIACIAGLLGNWKGEMRFGGKPFAPARRTDDRRRLGIVPQELAIYEGLSGRENLMFFGRLAGLKGEALVKAVTSGLELTGLVDRAGDRVGKYSGGMMRRLNIAAGDLHQPELLLLDEPTVGVDPQSRNHIFESLEALRKGGRTLIYTTHYMEEAQRLCDRVAIMNEGHVVALGSPRELAQEAGLASGNLEEVFLKLTGRSLRDE